VAVGVAVEEVGGASIDVQTVAFQEMVAAAVVAVVAVAVVAVTAVAPKMNAKEKHMKMLESDDHFRA